MSLFTDDTTPEQFDAAVIKIYEQNFASIPISVDKILTNPPQRQRYVSMLRSMVAGDSTVSFEERALSRLMTLRKRGRIKSNSLLDAK